MSLNRAAMGASSSAPLSDETKAQAEAIKKKGGDPLPVVRSKRANCVSDETLCLSVEYG